MTQNITLDQILSGLKNLSKEDLGRVQSELNSLTSEAEVPQVQVKPEPKEETPVAVSPLRHMDVRRPREGPPPLCERMWSLVGTLNADQALMFCRSTELSEILHKLVLVEYDNILRSNLNVIDKQRIVDAHLGTVLLAESLEPFQGAEGPPEGASTAVKTEGRSP
jgi:hypothetical protein